MVDNGFKPYPCGMVAHAAIDAVRELRGLASVDAELMFLRLRVSPETLSMMGIPDPRTGLQGKFSVRYEAAVAWVEGDVAPAAFEDVAVQRDEYQKVMARTVVDSDVGVAQQEAYAEVQTSDGERHAVHVPFARGTVQQPLTDDDLHAKFRTACATSGYPHAGKLAETIWHLDKISVKQLTAMLAGQW